MTVARRVGLFVLVAAIVIGARLLARGAVDVELDLALAASPRTVALVFTDEHEHVARELDLSYPSGAPAHDRRHVHLKKGRYTVGARLVFEPGRERTLSRELVVDEAGLYPLALD